MGLLYKIHAETVEALRDNLMPIAKGLAAIGRSTPVIGNAIEASQQAATSFSKFGCGERNQAGVGMMKSIITFLGVDAQMLTDNVNDVRVAFKHGGIVMGLTSAVLGTTEMIATVAGGSQFVGGLVREQLRHSMFADACRTSAFHSPTLTRTMQEVSQAKESVSTVRQVSRSLKSTMSV